MNCAMLNLERMILHLKHSQGEAGNNFPVSVVSVNLLLCLECRVNAHLVEVFTDWKVQ